MKSKSKYRKSNRRETAKRKVILAAAKKSFTRPKGGADSRYVIFDENTSVYFAPGGVFDVPYKAKDGSIFWTADKKERAVKFSKDSFGINDVIPLAPSWGAWRIIKLKK